ncbi:MAG: 1-acyl-sn-glycerol-3-phosphate acyltransferase [Bergeyella sp.]|nr:1-acyl-sn-glycerol-3-phosphate acyltransferase [Bergeyella sp.]
MLSLPNYLWRGWFVVLGTIFTLIFGLPVYLLSYRKKDYRYAYFFIRLWAYGIFYGMGFSYSFKNLSNSKLDVKQQYIIIANHTSAMDIMLMYILFPKHPICFVGKAEISKIPVLGLIYKRICILVDRSSPKSKMEVYTKCAQRLKEGNSIVIFPEGGVPDDTNIILDTFKKGAFVLSYKHRYPIAVYSIVGLKERFPFDNSKGYPGKISVFFNGILFPNSNTEDSKSRARASIKKTLTLYSQENKK